MSLADKKRNADLISEFIEFQQALLKWPLYVSDTGLVYCYGDNCPDPGEHIFTDRGRRVRLADFQSSIAEHMLRDHRLFPELIDTVLEMIGI